MSDVKRYTVSSIAGGISSAFNNAQPDTYLASVGIDADLPLGLAAEGARAIRTSSAIMPSTYSTFTTSEFSTSSVPLWLATNPKTSNSFVYTSGGKFASFTSAIAMRTTDEAGTALPITVASSSGNGMAYYNNYVYVASDSDIYRYGPLNSTGTLAMSGSFWVTTLGFSALTATAYVTVRNVTIPNHPMHVHVDGSLYFGDAKNGQGTINVITTKKITVEGDTNNGSAQQVLMLPFGYFPTDIESYGTDLVISAIQNASGSTGTVINQGRAALFFWDTLSNTYYNQVNLPDPLVTALLNKNGILYVFSGNVPGGARVSTYSGGNSVQQVAYLEEGFSPLAGGVDAFGDRVSFGGFTTYPKTSASVFSVGSKLGGTSLHNTVATTSAGTNPIATCVKYVQQANNSAPRVIVGWRDGATSKLDYNNDTDGSFTCNSVFRTQVFTPGAKFVVRSIRLPLTAAVDSSTTITPKIWVDDESSSFTLDTINNTNFSGKRNVLYKNPKMDGTQEVSGFHNLFLELTFSGARYIGVTFPIQIEVEIYEDEPTR